MKPCSALRRRRTASSYSVVAWASAAWASVNVWVVVVVLWPDRALFLGARLMAAKYASACSQNRPSSAQTGPRRFLFVDNSAPKRRRWDAGRRHLQRIEEA